MWYFVVLMAMEMKFGAIHYARGAVMSCFAVNGIVKKLVESRLQKHYA